MSFWCRLLAAALLLNGCSSLPPVMDPGTNYQRDIIFHAAFKHENQWSPYYLLTGTGVMPKAQAYRIKVFPTGKADLITLSSCHREWKTPLPEVGGGWFKAGHYEFEIPFSDTIDKELLCSFDIGVFESKKGRHGWGLLAISDSSKYNLPAKVKCNGQKKDYFGTSICQARSGLIQGYDFETKVSVAPGKGCEIKNLATTEQYSKEWRFKMPSGECHLYFIDILKPREKVHQAFFYGYDTIPIRQAK